MLAMCTTRSSRTAVFIGVYVFIILLFFSYGSKTRHPYVRFAKPQYNKFFQFLEGGLCQHVFMDIGTDTGMYLRQLYDPRYFRRANTIRVFNEVFGAVNRKHVCSIGFEPNPMRTEMLLTLQKEYQQKGRLVSILTETALSYADGNITLSRAISSGAFTASTAGGFSTAGKAWAAASMSVGTTNLTPKSFEALNNNTNKSGNVSGNYSVLSIDIDEFVRYLDRIWKRQGRESKLLVIMDVDGAEGRLINHMHDRGSLCLIDYMMIDWHINKGAGTIQPLLINSLNRSNNETLDVIQRQPPTTVREIELKLAAVEKSRTVTCRFHLVKKADYESFFSIDSMHHVLLGFLVISICFCLLLRKCNPRKVRTES